ncbi:MAG TPA: NADH-quinone oxidoreductase subunit NuoB [Gemmatimonadales bacterium]|jgi:Ni,Fe-hydrogenase III small subunit|nr:NADH-quinone oxidoreductase subunit NuoB [Gemmatimonadales bacterium]
MFDLIRTRLAQGIPTSSFPEGDPGFPARFRGRPVLLTEEAERPEPAADLPTGMLRQDAKGLPVLDLGACLFSPEEAAPLPLCPPAALPHCRTVFSRDHRMASRTREGLVTATGEFELAGALDARMRRLLGRSLRLRSVSAGSCNGCEAELVALSNVVFDMARFGVQFVASPRHADGIVITGAVSLNMREALERTYAAVPDPRLVIAVGACACSGGPFAESPEVLHGVPQEIPVDLWIPGCPPHPLTVLDGLLRLLGRLEDRAESSSS